MLFRSRESTRCLISQSLSHSLSLHRPLPSAILYSLYLSIKAKATSHKLFPLSPQTHTHLSFFFHPWLTPTPISSLLPHPSSVSTTTNISLLQTLLHNTTATSSTTPKPTTPPPPFSTTTKLLLLFLLCHLHLL